MESHLSHVAARVLLRKSLAVPNASWVFIAFSFTNFRVSDWY
jgi:hypothetical protein